MNDITFGPAVFLPDAANTADRAVVAEGSGTETAPEAVAGVAEDAVSEPGTEVGACAVGHDVPESAAAEVVAGVEGHGFPGRAAAEVEAGARVRITVVVVAAETDVPGAGETASMAREGMPVDPVLRPVPSGQHYGS